jgi:NADH:ubiquinone oxidoreductase subunit 6 (subunit J)
MDVMMDVVDVICYTLAVAVLISFNCVTVTSRQPTETRLFCNAHFIAHVNHHAMQSCKRHVCTDCYC